MLIRVSVPVIRFLYLEFHQFKMRVPDLFMIEADGARPTENVRKLGEAMPIFLRFLLAYTRCGAFPSVFSHSVEKA